MRVVSKLPELASTKATSRRREAFFLWVRACQVAMDKSHVSASPKSADERRIATKERSGPPNPLQARGLRVESGKAANPPQRAKRDWFTSKAWEPKAAKPRSGRRRVHLVHETSQNAARSHSRERDYSVTLVTTPAPTVRPPSRIAKRSPSSQAIGLVSSTLSLALSPGIIISTPSARVATPVTSVVLK